MTLTELAGLIALIYARKSSPNPKNPAKSTTDQMDVMVERVEARGGRVKRKFVDEGIGASRYSAKRIRADFEKLIACIESEPEVGVLAMWALSRGAREMEITAKLLNTCEKHGVLLLIGERLYDPARWEDRLQLGITSAVDEAEVARAREGTLRGIGSSAVDGRPHGRRCFGYRRVYNERSGALIRVEIDPVQGPIVREIVRDVLAGKTSRAICADLGSRGIGRTEGGTWHQADIRRICTRATYRGVRSHHGSLSEAMWPALITEEDSVRLTAIFARRTSGNPHTSNPCHPLTGVVECGRCPGQRMYYRNQQTASNKTPGYACPKCWRFRNSLHMEAAVRDVVGRWLADPDFHQMRRAKAADGVNTALEEKELRELSAELDDAYGLGLSARGLVAVESRVLPRIEELRMYLEDVEVARGAGYPELPLTLPAADSDEERDLLRRLVRVTCLESKRGPRFDHDSIRIDPI